MSSATLVPPGEYLSYRPDRDYVDGELREQCGRNGQQPGRKQLFRRQSREFESFLNSGSNFGCFGGV